LAVPKRNRKKSRAVRRPKPEAKLRRGKREIPDPDTVLRSETLTSPKGRRYTILETTQTDPYDVKRRGG
jgi:hypothetical protein